MEFIRTVKPLTKTEIGTKMWGISVTDLAYVLGRIIGNFGLEKMLSAQSRMSCLEISEDAAGRSANRAGLVEFQGEISLETQSGPLVLQIQDH